MALQPKRKEKPMLTFIPEEERAIAYRFTVALVGEGAAEFAHLAVHSDMAEAYKPKSAKPKPVEDLGQITEEGGDGDRLGPAAPVANSPSMNTEKKPAGQDDQYMMFCPTGPNTKELCRLRLQPCCGFSESLPLTKDEGAAKLLIVVLLFWNVKKGDESATSSTIGEWASRMAEINHHSQQAPSCKPYTVVLAYDTDSEQEKALKAFTDRMKGSRVPDPRLNSDSSEDGITESIQDLAEAAIGRLTQKRNSGFMGSGDEPLVPSKTRCCVIS